MHWGFHRLRQQPHSKQKKKDPERNIHDQLPFSSKENKENRDVIYIVTIPAEAYHYASVGTRQKKNTKISTIKLIQFIRRSTT